MENENQTKVENFLADQEKKIRNQKTQLKRFATSLTKYEDAISQMQDLAQELNTVGLKRRELQALFEIDNLLASKIFKRKREEKLVPVEEQTRVQETSFQENQENITQWN